MIEAIKNNSYYMTLIIVLVVWLVLFLYMLKVEKKINRIEKK